jgi:uncharacterized membrane protein
LATVIWIGGLAALSILVLPAARNSLDGQAYAGLLGSLQRRLDPLGWFSLVLLIGTGLVQMSANPNYEGFLAVNNRWAIAILLKHIFLLGMAGISAAMTWGVLPGLRRAALLQARGQETPQADRLYRREASLLRLNFILGIVILALTAVARVS